MPPVPHPRATKQFAAVEPVDRPLAQAIYEAKHAAAQKAAAEGKPYEPPKARLLVPLRPVPPPHGPTLKGEAAERLQEKMTREEQARREADRKAERSGRRRGRSRKGGASSRESGVRGQESGQKTDGSEPPSASHPVTPVSTEEP